jgi:hypothetical protein
MLDGNDAIALHFRPLRRRSAPSIGTPSCIPPSPAAAFPIRKSGALLRVASRESAENLTMTQRVKFAWRPSRCFEMMLVNHEGDETLSPIDRAAPAIRSS